MFKLNDRDGRNKIDLYVVNYAVGNIGLGSAGVCGFFLMR